ncbi:MAG: T9SS type A sorting domain-containing protein [Flavobacteriales bacterium]|jgi:hypothetical protein|nr:T9SS type A sorting domain-containing protein [Flavobacteriales bacterium]
MNKLFATYLLSLVSFYSFSQTSGQVIANANSYLNHNWTGTSANDWNSVSCGNKVVSAVNWYTAGNHTALPYCWGGNSTLAGFDLGISNGKSAGDSKTSYGYGAEPNCSVGVDCSGFTSRCYNLNTHYSTTMLNTNALFGHHNSYNDIVPGDFVNKPGSHVRLVVAINNNGSYSTIESGSGTGQGGSSGFWKVFAWTYNVSSLISSGYNPQYYTGMTTVPPVLDCNNATPLTCGVTYSGSSSNAPNAITTYGCNSWTETGPERVHTITPAHSGKLTAHLSSYTGDLDVYILGSCDPNDCLGTVYSDSAVVTNAIAGQTYYIVVDADDGSGSAYDLVVNCPPAPSILDCNNAIALTCGVTYNGTSSTATSNVSTYGCNNSNQTGPERVHTITPLSNGSITAVVSNFTGDLDVFILESCDASDCSGVVFQDSATLTNVVAGQTYYIVVDSDDGSGSSYDLVVNCQAQTGNNEDVVVNNPSVTPINVNAGDILTAIAQHTYTGSLYTTDLNSVDMDYYLSTDCTLSNDDMYLGGSVSDLGVDNPSSNEMINLSIPVTTAPGTYFILFAGDNGQDITESDETNNVSCVQITVSGATGTNDISLSNVTTNTDSIVAGEAVDVSSNQNYSGNQTANNLPSSELNYYLSTDCNLSPDDVLLGDDVSNIGSDLNSSNETESLVIPINTESGTYYILFVADDNNAINESNENNNIECVMLVVDGEFVSINEKDLQNHITLYPNPTEGMVTINSSEINIKEIEIYNVAGVKLEAMKFVNNNPIDLSLYANGIYYVRIIGDTDEKTTFKVIKQ